jgi:hypothetical protein
MHSKHTRTGYIAKIPGLDTKIPQQGAQQGTRTRCTTGETRTECTAETRGLEYIARYQD